MITADKSNVSSRGQPLTWDAFVIVSIVAYTYLPKVVPCQGLTPRWWLAIAQ